jgi:hypothetical protein
VEFGQDLLVVLAHLETLSINDAEVTDLVEIEVTAAGDRLTDTGHATSSPKIALIKVDLPTPVLPKIAKLNRPSAAFCFSYSRYGTNLGTSPVLPAIGPRVRGAKN